MAGMVPKTEDPAKEGIRKKAASGSAKAAVGRESGSTGGGQMREALGSSSFGGEGTSSLVGETGLKSAVDDLYKQHPQGYDSHGPHHGTQDHVRHQPLHGLRPTK